MQNLSYGSISVFEEPIIWNAQNLEHGLQFLHEKEIKLQVLVAIWQATNVKFSEPSEINICAQHIQDYTKKSSDEIKIMVSIAKNLLFKASAENATSTAAKKLLKICLVGQYTINYFKNISSHKDRELIESDIDDAAAIFKTNMADLKSKQVI